MPAAPTAMAGRSALLASVLLVFFAQHWLLDATSSPSPPASVDVGARCPKLRIALVNGVSFHFEILAGLLHALRPYQHITDVFLGPYIRSTNYDGAWDFLKWSRTKFTRVNVNPASLPGSYDLVILVSADYELQSNQALLKHMHPKLVVAFVHNADFKQMGQLLALAPQTELVALSPHVAVSTQAATGHKTAWMLATMPTGLRLDDLKLSLEASAGPEGCRQEMFAGQDLCMRGFAMQGKFSNLRRNYSSMWSQLQEHSAALHDPQVLQKFHFNVLGKGPDRLNLPPELQDLVSVHRRLPYKRFYSLIARTYGLVPSLASPRYFTHKFSSTIATSLSTGTPVIATQQLLTAYSFLTEDTVYLQAGSEEEVDVMLRVVKMSAQELLAKRTALMQLRKDLNAKAFQMLEGYIERACSTTSAAAAAA